MIGSYRREHNLIIQMVGAELSFEIISIAVGAQGQNEQQAEGHLMRRLATLALH